MAMVIQVAASAFRGIAKAGPKLLVLVGAAAVAGISAGTKGAVDNVRARSVRKAATQRYDEAVAECQEARLNAELVALQYGDFQMRAHQGTVGRFADWLERNEHLVKRLNFKRVDGVWIRVPDIPKYKAAVGNVTAGLSGVVSAVGTGVSAQAGALWGVSTFASASTGTAISSLSGAAAQNAMLAWLGGGSLASGGGGVAVGTAVLSLVTVVPMLLIGGMTLGVIGAGKKTKAREYAAIVEVEIGRIQVAQALLLSTERRIGELRQVLTRLVERATAAIDELEVLDFDPKLHAREFLRALQLVTAVKEVLNTPILDPESGELTEASVEVVRKYA
jgi:hypothetical protein